MRILNLCVVVLLILAAAYVYEIKFESTLRAERLAQIGVEIRRERDLIAALQAEWAKLDNPARLQDLIRRHLPLGPAQGYQFDSFDRLPERPPQIKQPEANDAMAADPQGQDTDAPTGSIPNASTPNAMEQR